MGNSICKKPKTQKCKVHLLWRINIVVILTIKKEFRTEELTQVLEGIYAIQNYTCTHKTHINAYKIKDTETNL